MNKDSLFLFLLIVILLFISFVNDVFVLSVCLVVVIGTYVAFGGSLKSLIKTVKRVLTFCIVLSSAYYVHALIKGLDPFQYILLFNLRLMNMVISVLFFREFANPTRAFGFSKTLSYMFTLTYSQIQVYMKLYEEFRLVMKSRMIHADGYSRRLSFFTKMVEYFFKKAIKRSEDTAMTMKARGFFLYD